MANDHVKETFERCASDYDELIKKIVPHYLEQHEIILSLMPFETQSVVKALDLGIGTGALSEIILSYYSYATVLGVDLSEKMISVAKNRLKPFAERTSFVCGDIDSIGFDNDYDLVLAGLAIHHLQDENKRIFFGKIYSALKKGGVFVIRDIIKSESDRLNEFYHDQWCLFEKNNGIDPDKISEDSKHNDIPATVENHLAWLKNAGFADVDCVWKHNNLAVLVAYK